MASTSTLTRSDVKSQHRQALKRLLDLSVQLAKSRQSRRTHPDDEVLVKNALDRANDFRVRLVQVLRLSKTRTRYSWRRAACSSRWRVLQTINKPTIRPPRERGEEVGAGGVRQRAYTFGALCFGEALRPSSILPVVRITTYTTFPLLLSDTALGGGRGAGRGGVGRGCSDVFCAFCISRLLPNKKHKHTHTRCRVLSFC